MSVTPPPQPTPTSIESTLQDLSQITSDPMSAWEAGNYAVRAACHAYLNQAAAKSANVSLASGATGLAGTAAAGLLLTGGNPIGAAAAGVFSSLIQSFLSQYNSSGALPYSPETSSIIENALDAYAEAVDEAPPTTIAEAASYVDDLWFDCSPGGYAILVTKAISTASVTAGSLSGSIASTTFLMPSESSALPRTQFLTTHGRPTIRVNGR